MRADPEVVERRGADDLLATRGHQERGEMFLGAFDRQVMGFQQRADAGEAGGAAACLTNRSTVLLPACGFY